MSSGGEDNDNVTEISTGGAAGELDMSAITASLRLDPQLMAALAGNLQDLAGRRSGFVPSPKDKRRVSALEQLQADRVRLEVEFHNEVALLEQKYNNLYKPLFEKRKAIIMGQHDPTDEELYPETQDDDEEAAPPAEEPEAEEEGEEDAKPGLPHFWLNCLTLDPVTEKLIHKNDEEALEYLSDITLEYLEGANNGFSLHFHFEPNPFFTNTVLTKTYHLSPGPESDLSLMYEGPIFQSATGSKIEWKEGQDLTSKVVKKKQRKKGGRNAGQTRMITRQVPQASFFNFFNPPDVVDENEERPEVIEACMEMLHEDYDVGEFIAEKIIPNAVLYYTGEILGYESDGEEEEEEEDGYGEGNDDDDDDDEDNDPDYKPPSGEQPPECQQA